jgi:DNA-binding protein HU-beta
MVQDDYVAPFSAESTYAANAPLPQLGLPAPKPTITSSVQRPALKTLSRPFSRKVSTATAATAATTISSSQTGTVGATPVSSLQTGTSAPVAAKSTLSRRAPRTATTTSRLTSATTTTATTVPAPTPVPVQVPAPATTVSVPIPVAATTVPVSAPATTVQTVPATTTRQLGPARMKALSTLRRPARAAGETASTTSIKPEERAEPTESGIATGAIAETSSTTATPSTAGTRRTLRPGLRRGVAGVATQTQSTTNP